jgi:hypothetical protein
MPLIIVLAEARALIATAGMFDFMQAGRENNYFSLSPIRFAAVHRLTDGRPDWRA